MDLVSNFKSTNSLKNTLYYRPPTRVIADTTVYVYDLIHMESDLPIYVMYILFFRFMDILPSHSMHLIYLCNMRITSNYINYMGDNIIYCGIHRNKGKFLYHSRQSDLKIGKDTLNVIIINVYNKVVYLEITGDYGYTLIKVWFYINGDVVKAIRSRKHHRILLNAIYVIKERIKIIPQSLCKLDFVKFKK